LTTRGRKVGGDDLWGPTVGERREGEERCGGPDSSASGSGGGTLTGGARSTVERREGEGAGQARNWAGCMYWAEEGEQDAGERKRERRVWAFGPESGRGSVFVFCLFFFFYPKAISKPF